MILIIHEPSQQQPTPSVYLKTWYYEQCPQDECTVYTSVTVDTNHQTPTSTQLSRMINTKHLSIIQWHRDTVSDNLLISTIQLQQLSINIFTFREKSGPINLSRKTSDAITTPSSTLASLLVTSSLGWSSSVLVTIVRAENLSQCCITQHRLETGNFNV